MHQGAHRLRLGLPSMDDAHYSAPPSPVEKIAVLRCGLAVLELPRMPHVKHVHAPGTGGDVIIRIAEPMPRLARMPANDLQARALRARSFLIIPEGLSTDFAAEGGQPRCFHLHVPSTARAALEEDIGNGQIRPRVNFFDIELDYLFGAMVREIEDGGPFMRLRLQGLALSALARVLRVSEPAEPRSGSTATLTPARLRRIEEYVEDHLAADICLEDMAACVGLSPSHFSRAFKAETGKTPYAWVISRRIDRVKDNLLAGKGRLAEIAVECGFANLSHMTDAFRRATGMAPARWLRETGVP